MTITKIQQTDDKVAVSYEESAGAEGLRTVNFTSKELPQPELSEAMRNMLPVLRDVCGLPHQYILGMLVRAVLFKSSKAGTRSFAVKGEKQVMNGSLFIQTPYQVIGSSQLKADTQDELVDLMAQATRYVNGARAQQDLPLEEKEVNTALETEYVTEF